MEHRADADLAHQLGGEGLMPVALPRQRFAGSTVMSQDAQAGASGATAAGS